MLATICCLCVPFLPIKTADNVAQTSISESISRGTIDSNSAYFLVPVVLSQYNVYRCALNLCVFGIIHKFARLFCSGRTEMVFLTCLIRMVSQETALLYGEMCFHFCEYLVGCLFITIVRLYLGSKSIPI